MPAIVSTFSRTVALVTLLGVLSPGTASSQGSSGLIGRVYDAVTQEPMTEVVILVDSVRQNVSVSRQGRFVLTGLQPGQRRLEIRAIGYRPVRVDFTALADQVQERDFHLAFTGERLPDIAVESRNSRLLTRFQDFERRRANKLGHFITRDEIKSRGYMNIGDAVRTVKGVRVTCGPLDCLIRMSRASNGCLPTYYVDGNVARSFAVTTPVSDIQGIEVYRGSAELPGEFSGSGGMCGVIAIWTRAAP
jgi:hypothetical protein